MPRPRENGKVDLVAGAKVAGDISESVVLEIGFCPLLAAAAGIFVAAEKDAFALAENGLVEAIKAVYTSFALALEVAKRKLNTYQPLCPFAMFGQEAKKRYRLEPPLEFQPKKAKEVLLGLCLRQRQHHLAPFGCRLATPFRRVWAAEA